MKRFSFIPGRNTRLLTEQEMKEYYKWYKLHNSKAYKNQRSYEKIRDDWRYEIAISGRGYCDIYPTPLKISDCIKLLSVMFWRLWYAR